MAPWSTCFNPRARGGRDNCQSPRETERMLFQSTRPRRARRRQGSMCTYRSRCFNPRARGGRDQWPPSGLGDDSSFNPRARGGRDGAGAGYADGRHCFNPRARGGRDAQKALDKRINTRFQSTRPRRARLKTSRCHHVLTHSFNPRARGGRDASYDGSSPLTRGFNPRARGGRDKRDGVGHQTDTQFQSTRPRRARPKTANET